MNPELVHFQCFEALKYVFEVRDIVLNIVRTCPSLCITHTDSQFGDQLLEKSLCDLFYEDEGDGRITNGYWGLIEADPILFEAIRKLNQAKTKFKAVNIEMEKLDPNSEAQIIKSLKNPGSWPERLEHYAPDYGRLNINHVYRQYSVSESRPLKVQQSWASKDKSVVKITKSQAIQRLLKIDESLPPHLRIQYEKLASLKETESLAVVRSQTPSIKTNLFFEGQSLPKTTTSKLPVVVPLGPGRIYCRFMNSKKNWKRKAGQRERNDVRLEPSAIAPSIHVYRYRDQHA